MYYAFPYGATEAAEIDPTYEGKQLLKILEKAVDELEENTGTGPKSRKRGGPHSHCKNYSPCKEEGKPLPGGQYIQECNYYVGAWCASTSTHWRQRYNYVEPAIDKINLLARRFLAHGESIGLYSSSTHGTQTNVSGYCPTDCLDMYDAKGNPLYETATCNCASTQKDALSRRKSTLALARLIEKIETLFADKERFWYVGAPQTHAALVSYIKNLGKRTEAAKTQSGFDDAKEKLLKSIAAVGEREWYKQPAFKALGTIAAIYLGVTVILPILRS